MPHHACPWWLGRLLASPLRRLMYRPEQILSPYVREGMTVLEPGPGMGFFTLELARMVGDSGHVIAVDIQPRMLSGLKKRAARAGLLDRIEVRLAQPDSLGVKDLAGRIDFVLAFAMVHEMPSAESFFAQTFEVMKTGANMLLVEPSGHVKLERFDQELHLASGAGFQLEGPPQVRHSHSALLTKPT